MLGDYARKQLFGRSFFLRWSHGARFRFATSLVERLKPQKLLDYGCGDGTFLHLVGSTFQRFGFDTDVSQLSTCRSRFPEIRFLAESELANESFDCITCMEVAEHCTDIQRAALYERIGDLLTPEGIVIFSVPIEIGPTLLFKQSIRMLLALRRGSGYEYRETYSVAEFCKMLFATRHSAIPRPHYEDKAAALDWHGHKGFNWRFFEAELQARFQILSRHFTPNSFSGGFLSSQAWFVCRLASPPAP